MPQQNPMVVVEQAIAKIQPTFENIARQSGNLVRYQEEARFALQAMRRNPYMQRCMPQTIEDAVVNIAAVGLSLNPILGHGFLIPRRQGNNVICCFDPGYRGLIKLATDGGLVKSIQACAVYEEEVRSGNFKLTRGTDPSILHNTDPLMKPGPAAPSSMNSPHGHMVPSIIISAISPISRAQPRHAGRQSHRPGARPYS